MLIQELMLAGQLSREAGKNGMSLLLKQAEAHLINMFSLERSHWVQAAFCQNISRMRKFCSIKSANVKLHLFESNGCLPPFSVRGNAKIPGFIVSLGLALVLLIFRVSRFAQVGPSIILSKTILMVDLVGGPFVSHVKPCQSVCSIGMSHDADVDISALVTGATCIFTSTGFGPGPTFGKPNEFPGPGVVVKKFAQTRYGKIGISHEALLLLIGQRPARVDSTGWLRYFNTYVFSFAEKISKCLRKSIFMESASSMPANHGRPFPSWALTQFNAHI